MTTTRPWFCPRTDAPALYPDTDGRCPSGTHDTYSAKRQGCRSGAAFADDHRYNKLRRAGRARPRLTHPAGLVRRIEACYFMGWDAVEIAGIFGFAKQNISNLRLRATHGERVQVKVVERMAPELERLASRWAPDSPRARRARVLARREGFVPLLAWDDIDDPAATPVLDEPAPRRLSLVEVDDYLLDEVLNPTGGRRFADCSIAEQDHVVDRLWRDAVFEGYDKPGKRVAERLEIDPALIEMVRGRQRSRVSRTRKEAS